MRSSIRATCTRTIIKFEYLDSSSFSPFPLKLGGCPHPF